MATKEFLGRKRLYHATSGAAGEAILQSRQMHPGKEGLFGGAIYFADSPESARIKSRADGTSVPHSIVIVADVDLGVAVVFEGGRSDMNIAKLRNDYNCNSVKGRASPTSKWEFIVYDPSVITVVALILADPAPPPPPDPWPHGSGHHPHGPHPHCRPHGPHHHHHCHHDGPPHGFHPHGPGHRRCG
jgi:hypothetical protein